MRQGSGEREQEKTHRAMGRTQNLGPVACSISELHWHPVLFIFKMNSCMTVYCQLAYSRVKKRAFIGLSAAAMFILETSLSSGSPSKQATVSPSF